MTPPTHAAKIIGYRVSIRNLKFGHPKRPVLQIDDLDIESGQFLAVVGENGAGKSSLLAAIAGELSGIDGEVVVYNTRISRPINRHLDGVGIVHQADECDFIGSLSIAQNVAIRQLLGRGHRGLVFAVGGAWQRERIYELSQVAPRFSQDFSALARSLSGGERQILNVALAVHLEHKNNPCKLILLDEHTAKLDHSFGPYVMEYTAQQIRDVGCTAVMITHRYDDAIRHCDRILVIRKGKLTHDLRRGEIDVLTEQQLAALVEGRSK